VAVVQPPALAETGNGNEVIAGAASEAFARYCTIDIPVKRTAIGWHIVSPRDSLLNYISAVFTVTL